VLPPGPGITGGSAVQDALTGSEAIEAVFIIRRHTTAQSTGRMHSRRALLAAHQAIRSDTKCVSLR
jgi:hypothetical protein